MKERIVPLIISLLLIFSKVNAGEKSYLWLDEYSIENSIKHRIETPPDFYRENIPDKSFGKWLRFLPLKEGKPPVYLYDGSKKLNQKAHFVVIDIDIGNSNLQQCADIIMRLRAEYLYSKGLYDSIGFNYTSGDRAEFRKWILGLRPVINGNHVSWKMKSAVDSSYTNFRNYLNNIFAYAGSYSLSGELKKVDLKNMKTGDVFIEGGFPGHAVIVVDMAVNTNTGEKIFLLAQSFMPAQDLHILKNPYDSLLSPWYSLNFKDSLLTPEWIFDKNDLKR